jgi:superfamily II DNA/RNA helicase
MTAKMEEIKLAPRFSSLYEDLLTSDAERSITRRAPTAELSEESVAYLLGTATRFALISDVSSAAEARYCHYAYEVAVRVSGIPAHAKQFAGISEMILSRLGNFPARRLLREKTDLNGTGTDPFLEIESIVRESENRWGSEPDAPLLTDFQVKLLGALSKRKYVSVSAPTSAGKSFTLEIDLLRKINQKTNFTAIFLVPTRALIRQVSLDLVALMRTKGVDVSVISAPSAANADETHPTRTIFVLTQERLATLLQSAPPSFAVDAFIVDEAQEVAKEERGQTLERALRQALALHPSATIFFSSPLRSNPAYLLTLFDGEGDASEHFIEFQAPVTQNMVSLRHVAGAPKKMGVFVEIEGKEKQLEVRDVPFKFRGSCLGHVAYHFTGADEASIVFCNRPSAADKQALQLFEDIAKDEGDPDLNDFAKFLETEVHRLYRLPSFIRRGVAFHYSNIPQIVRGRIEELLRLKKLSFVCCTSTLLQGVNLPAKNIFVENPKGGKGRAMDPGDFWNLVGRAGRLNHEFTGNVFKVYTKAWDSDPTQGDRLVPIESAFQIAVEKNTPALAFFCDEPPKSSESDERWAEQAIASVYARFISSQDRLGERINEGPNHEAALKVDNFCAQFQKSKQTLPDEHYEKNFYVHPQRLESLAAFLRSQPSIRNWLPTVPKAQGSYDRLVTIFQVIDDYFIQEGTRRHEYFAVLALLWMQGTPLKELVRDRLERHGASNDAEKANDEIRQLFSDIEERIRYIYVKYMGIYNSVLGAILREKDLHEEAESIIPIHLFLEFGASSKALINFMSIGLSRTSAILLQNSAKFRDDLEVDACRRYLDTINLEYSPLPAICKAEIKHIRGR